MGLATECPKAYVYKRTSFTAFLIGHARIARQWRARWWRTIAKSQDWSLGSMSAVEPRLEQTENLLLPIISTIYSSKPPNHPISPEQSHSFLCSVSSDMSPWLDATLAYLLSARGSRRDALVYLIQSYEFRDEVDCCAFARSIVYPWSKTSRCWWGSEYTSS